MRRPSLRPIVAVFALLLLVAQPSSARDRGADGEFTKRASPHFVVYQDVDIDHYAGKDGIRAFERKILSVLEDAHREVSKRLSLRPSGKTRVEIYDAAVFDKKFNSIFNYQAVGFYYNGGISVRGAKTVSENHIQTLHHEYVHRVVDSLAPGLFPSWLNEGLAEYFERLAVGRSSMHSGESRYLKRAVSGNRWIPLANLNTFSGLDDDNAGLAYLQGYAMVDYLVSKRGERKFRDFLKQYIRSRDLNKSLKRRYKLDVRELEEAVVDQFQ